MRDKDGKFYTRYPYPRSSKLKYTIDEVLKKMEDALKEYEDNRQVVSYWRILKKYDLPQGYLKHWLQEGQFPELTELMIEFQDIQRERIVENGLLGDYNSGFAKFLLEANHGFTTEYQRQKIDQNQQSIDMTQGVRIGFGEVVGDDDIPLIDIEEDSEDEE